MSGKGNSKVIFPILCGFFVMGFVDLVGISANFVRSDFALSDSMANLLPMMVFVWFALFSIPTGLLMGRYGRRDTVIAGMALTAAAMVIPVFCYSFPAMLVAFALLGIGNTILQVALNPMAAAVVNPSRISSVLTWGQFIKAVSSLLGPLAAGAAVKITGNWLSVFPVYAGVTLLSALWLRFGVPATDSGEKNPGSIRSVMALCKDPLLALYFLAIVCVVGIDVGLNTTIPALLMRNVGLPVHEAGLGTSLYFAARMAGTFVGAMLLARVAPRPFLRWSAVLALVAFAILPAGDSLSVIGAGIILAGLACANIFSIVFALALEHRPDASNQVSALMIIGVAGGALVPPLMGLLTDAFGLTAGMLILPLCMLPIGYASFAGKKREQTHHVSPEQ